MSLIVLWLQFIACSVVIWVGGTQLLRQGEAIARLTGLSGTWIGLILLATVTSIPELITGVTSVTVADAADVAVGDVLGSCVFNLVLIALLDALQRPSSMFSLADRGQIVGAARSGTSGRRHRYWCCCTSRQCVKASVIRGRADRMTLRR
jgi:cation:H+ antiporter